MLHTAQALLVVETLHTGMDYWIVSDIITYQSRPQDELSGNPRVHFYQRRCHRRGVLGLALCRFDLSLGS